MRLTCTPAARVSSMAPRRLAKRSGSVSTSNTAVPGSDWLAGGLLGSQTSSKSARCSKITRANAARVALPRARNAALARARNSSSLSSSLARIVASKLLMRLIPAIGKSSSEIAPESTMPTSPGNPPAALMGASMRTCPLCRVRVWVVLKVTSPLLVATSTLSGIVIFPVMAGSRKNVTNPTEKSAVSRLIPRIATTRSSAVFSAVSMKPDR